MKTENITYHLKQYNIKPSYLRIKVLEYLLAKKNHPTVDMIFNELAKEIPTLSKTTIYNTLKLFTDNKIVKIVTIENNEVRYDADISEHGHLKCEKCKKIYDFRIQIPNTNIDGLDGFEITEKEINFKGTCQECLKTNN